MNTTLKFASYTLGVFVVGLYVGQKAQHKYTVKRVQKIIPATMNMLENLFDLALKTDVIKDDLRKHAIANIKIITDSLHK